MPKRLAVLLAAVIVLATFPAAGALAAGSKTSIGTIVSYTKTSLVVKVKGKKTDFTLPKKVICGFTTGQSGGPIACSTFKHKLGKTVTVYWTKTGSKDVASEVLLHEK
jgi:uncharacterized membrane protein YoaK (UPF0700 family)